MNLKPRKENSIVAVILFVLTAAVLASLVICTDMSKIDCFLSSIIQPIILVISIVVTIIGYLITSYIKK